MCKLPKNIILLGTSNTAWCLLLSHVIVLVDIMTSVMDVVQGTSEYHTFAFRTF